jgi:hypothetical protein
VIPQTLAQYNACSLPNGMFNGQAINGQSVPGIGTLQQVGPLSQTTFIPAPNTTNFNVTVYACRPTVAPAWLNSPNYPGNAVSIANFPGGPEPYANGNGPNGGPAATTVTGCSSPNETITGAALTACQAGKAPVPSITALTCPLLSNPGGPNGPPAGPISKLAVFRPVTHGGVTTYSFLEDNNGNFGFDGTPTDKFITNFFPAGSGVTPAANGAGDIAVYGDWVGDGKTRVGIYRQSTGQWFLDINNDGVYDAGDATYSFGGFNDTSGSSTTPPTAGGTGFDKPVVGDWAGTGKSCIGVFRQGFLWVLDLNCNGTFDGTGANQDAAFAFGGIAGDVPVTYKTGGLQTKVGVVRKYVPIGGQPQGSPFFWVLDQAAAGAAQASHGVASTGPFAPFAYGGLANDVFLTGDWGGAGCTRPAVYRAGIWVLDIGGGLATQCTQATHSYDTAFPFGGIATDQPMVGFWAQ